MFPFEVATTWIASAGSFAIEITTTVDVQRISLPRIMASNGLQFVTMLIGRPNLASVATPASAGRPGDKKAPPWSPSAGRVWEEGRSPISAPPDHAAYRDSLSTSKRGANIAAGPALAQW
jgi:hypothetical protein